jgi:hypothetical protein
MAWNYNMAGGEGISTFSVHIAVASITPQCNAFRIPKPRVLNMLALYPIEAIEEWRFSEWYPHDERLCLSKGCAHSPGWELNLGSA